MIGTNIIKYLNSNAMKENATRMKFSTTTTDDLLDSYKHQMPLDLKNFYAGEARHMLDWLWGINLSRALTYAVHGQSLKNALSIGQGAGAIACNTCKERSGDSEVRAKAVLEDICKDKQSRFRELKRRHL